MLDISVVIPTHNRKEILLQTLRALTRSLPRDVGHEVIVVDDGSNDGTGLAVQRWSADHGAFVRPVLQSRAGRSAARNRGAQLASGRVLIFIDDDILVPPEFVHRHLETLARNPGAWVMGRVRQADNTRRTPLGRYEEASLELWYRERPTTGLSEIDGIGAQNLSLPADDFRALGGFDEQLTSGEDWDLGTRARRDGIRLLYCPDIVVTHNGWSASLRQLCERHRLYSRTDVLLCIKYGNESPRWDLVNANGPVRWGRDSPGLMGRKVTKQLLSTPPGRSALVSAAKVAEVLTPDRLLSRRLYDAAVAMSIFRGVREGIRCYGLPTAVPGAGTGALW